MLSVLYMIWHGYREIYNNIIVNTYVYGNDNHINYNQTGWESFRLLDNYYP